MANDFLEKTLEEIIFENRKTVNERGLPRFYKNSKRQFLLPSGKKIDILTWEIDVVNNNLYATIYELKKDTITESALFQAIDYHEEFFCVVKPDYNQLFIDMALVGSDFNRNAALINHQSDDIKIFTYEYQYDGIRFEQYPITKTFGKNLQIMTDPEHAQFLQNLRNWDTP